MDPRRVQELLDDRERLGEMIEAKLAELRAVEPRTRDVDDGFHRLEQRLGEARRAIAGGG
ncbi:MAG TPA: hypothetical protein VF549_18845 [Solirubrobacteraceae bacterium]|jgi:hypothetical protein